MSEQQELPLRPKHHVALLSPSGVLIGYDDVEELGENMVLLDGKCDLVPHKYKYVPEHQRFDPCEPGEKPLDMNAESLPAIALALREISKTIKLPAKSLSWLDWYEKTIDGAIPGKDQKK